MLTDLPMWYVSIIYIVYRILWCLTTRWARETCEHYRFGAKRACRWDRIYCIVTYCGVPCQDEKDITSYANKTLIHCP